MILDFLKNIFCSNNEKIKELENELQLLVDEHTEMLTYLKEKNEDLVLANKLNNEYKIIISSKDQEIKNLKYKLEGQNVKVEKPTFLSGKMLYRPKRRFVSKTKDFLFTFEKPQHTFDKSPYLKEILEKGGYIGCAKNIINAKKIKNFVTVNYTYERDNSDNWRPVTDTLLSGLGDCEDVTQVLVSAYGICGWKPNEVFNGCGIYDEQFGHSYGILKIGSKWMIFEGTNKTNLMSWKAHPEYRANYGVCNWKFDGMIAYGGKVVDRILDDDEM